ncbi:putative RND superfamily exporter protein [Altererythrobacter atlanticus]|uniref:Uncharacterized protein n=1 Tax=Croceibacterium atlanticum TaxID=1267766 RepID=A0A0F7KSX9_9SPHN|nr:HIG1 domain-containing protein [Croceibacterium atlanticum]AKH43503.1 hypothetical protein WYH_02473 [Croceibacterium atlanticum]MBB5731789.1 putative RND superfamily exporter protein [Croceibacterium atlanticum]
MTYLLILAIIGLAIMVVVSLVRGIIAFLQSSRLEVDNPEEAERVGRLQLKQNQMMFARIKYQALAVAVVAVLLMISR